MNVIRYKDAVDRINVHAQENWTWRTGSRSLNYYWDDDCGHAVSVLEVFESSEGHPDALYEWDGHVKPDSVWTEVAQLLLEHDILCEPLTLPVLQYPLPMMDTSCDF